MKGQEARDTAKISLGNVAGWRRRKKRGSGRYMGVAVLHSTEEGRVGRRRLTIAIDGDADGVGRELEAAHLGLGAFQHGNTGWRCRTLGSTCTLDEPSGFEVLSPCTRQSGAPGSSAAPGCSGADLPRRISWPRSLSAWV